MQNAKPESLASTACTACGLELDPDQIVLLDSRPYCGWCWSNDCCRVSRDAAVTKEKAAAGASAADPFAG